MEFMEIHVGLKTTGSFYGVQEPCGVSGTFGIQTGTFSQPKIDEFELGFECHDYWKLIGPGIVLERRVSEHGRIEYDVPGPRKYDGGVDV
jgi:hypothetical protein